jgi:predicted O-methyltransferase YrrM
MRKTKVLHSIREHFPGQARLVTVILKKRANSCQNIDDCLRLAFGFLTSLPEQFRWTIEPAQVRDEITNLLKILAKQKPKNILEIGTAWGGTLFLFAKVASPQARIVSVDIPNGYAGGYPEWRVNLYQSFGMPEQKICLIREDSHLVSTLGMVEAALEGCKLDFLFIDGDHTYDGVRKDFEMYCKLVRKGGLIAFHDIVPGHLCGWVGGVPRFWDEIKHNFSHIELVKNWKQGGCGIGILYV